MCNDYEQMERQTMDCEENFAWYQNMDKDNYFVIATLNKNIYKKDD